MRVVVGVTCVVQCGMDLSSQGRKRTSEEEEEEDILDKREQNSENDEKKEKHMKYEEIKCSERSKLHPDVTKEVHFVTPIQPPLFPFPI